jgi:hypothetical protein
LPGVFLEARESKKDARAFLFSIARSHDLTIGH